MTWKRTCQLIKSDVLRRVQYEGLAPSTGNCLAAFFAAASLALVIYRVQHFFYTHHVPVVNKLLTVLNIVLFATEIQVNAQLGEGFLMLNPNGVMVHGRVTCGKNCTVVHQMTTALGPRVGADLVNDSITIGDNVVLGAGARIIGNVSIGSDCWIGPNKVISQSVPSGTILM